jgi:acid phosphatase (class A)
MKIPATALLAGVLAGCATAPVPPTNLPEVRPGYVAGYLTPDKLPDTLSLLPPPPAEGSAAQEADREHYKSLGPLQGGARWKLAIEDADLLFPHAARVFACALQVEIDPQSTPHLYIMLRRIRMDASRANDIPKDRYKRARPFMVTKEASCVPKEEPRYKPDSYPSGHASIGWAWALALAEIAPERANEVLKRGYAYGESRAICRVHWKSDLEAGRIVGAATVSRLHAEPLFTAQMALAREEIAAARAAGRGPKNCDMEPKDK